MKILVVNSGSSSLKFQLYEVTSKSETVIAKGKCDGIGKTYELGNNGNNPFIQYKKKNKEWAVELSLPNHYAAIEAVLQRLVDPRDGGVSQLSKIDAVAHRIVNAGPKFTKSVLLTDKRLRIFEEESLDYAPVHNGPALNVIRAIKWYLPNCPQVLTFDTTFHQTMPEKAKLYAIPIKYRDELGVQKYGAHGLSHEYVTHKAAEMLHMPEEELNMISCHLGSGSSLCAIKHGKSVDTSMGFTPLEGLVMRTRSGDIDPAALQYIMKKTGMSIDDVLHMLNDDSGLKALSGIESGDLRAIMEARLEGDKRATLAVEMFTYRVSKYIGAYLGAMDEEKVHCITFEGGIGENNLQIVKDCVKGFSWLGIHFNDRFLKEGRHLGEVSNPLSTVKIFVIPTDEEIIIAKEALKVLKSS